MPAPRVVVPVPGFTDPVRTEVEKKVRQRLKLPVGQALPGNIQTLINNAVAETTDKALGLAVNRDVESAIRNVYRPAQMDSFREKVGAARAGIDLIAQSTDVDGILKRRAELLFKKRQALTAAGFTNDEAMQIVLADLSGEH